MTEVSNPFSTRFHAPGALPWLSQAGPDPSALAERLVAADVPMAIVGPHGSGKSSLALAVAHELQHRSGWSVVRAVVDRRGAVEYEQLDPSKFRSCDNPSIVLLDGVERCNWWRRRRVVQTARRTIDRVLLTLHDPASCTVLHELRPTIESAQRVVKRLLEHHSADRHPEPDLVERLFREHRGNIRDLLFDLYDWWEETTRRASTAPRDARALDRSSPR